MHSSTNCLPPSFEKKNEKSQPPYLIMFLFNFPHMLQMISLSFHLLSEKVYPQTRAVLLSFDRVAPAFPQPSFLSLCQVLLPFQLPLPPAVLSSHQRPLILHLALAHKITYFQLSSSPSPARVLHRLFAFYFATLLNNTYSLDSLR
jgi:hypothetical protein